MPRRLLIASLLLGFGVGASVAGALAATGMKGAAVNRQQAAKDGGTLVVGSVFFDVIDPALTPDPTYAASVSSVLAAWGVADATCAMLLRYPVGPPTRQDYSLAPEAAAGYPAVTRDGRTYTFTIRKGIRFSNGARVTAANYARAIERVVDPAMRSPAAPYMQEVVGVKAAGDRLVVRLTKRVPDFPARMTMPNFCPVPKDLPIAREGVDAPVPGSGPYVVAEFVRGKQVVLKRNPYYVGSRPRHLDRLVIQVGDDIVTWSRKVEADTADVDLNVPVPRMDELGAKYAINKGRLFSVASSNLFYLFMNTERPLFRQNARLRQAVNFALDRPQMLSALGPPWSGSVTDDYLPPGLPGYVDAHPYALRVPNLAKARSLAAGHTRDGKAVLYTCELIISGCKESAQFIQAALKKIGIDVEIKDFPYAVYQNKSSTRGEAFDLVFERFVVPWVDPYQYVNRLLDGRTIQATENTNRSFFNSARYNRLIDQAGRLSGRARYDAYNGIAVAVAKDAAPMAAAYVRNTRFLVSSRVGCVRAGAHGLDIGGLCLK